VGVSFIISLNSIQVKIHLKLRDLLILQSDIILHKVKEWEGERYSFVYFFNYNVFTEQEQNKST
jgi:hypothetical protein